MRHTVFTTSIVRCCFGYYGDFSWSFPATGETKPPAESGIIQMQYIIKSIVSIINFVQVIWHYFIL